MRFFVAGNAAAWSLEQIFARALRRLGHLVHFLPYPNSFTARPWVSLEKIAQNRFTDVFEKRRVRVAFEIALLADSTAWDVVLVFKGMEFSPTAIRKWMGATPSAVWVNINPDNPFAVDSSASRNIEVIEAIPLFDLYCTWSTGLVSALVAAGAKAVVHLPFGYDSALHIPSATPAKELAEKVVFVGSWDRAREKILAALEGLPIVIFGTAWQRRCTTKGLRPMVLGGPLFGESLRAVVGGAAGCINILRPQNEDSHNMRTFEVPAMGGLLITTRTREQERFFPEGVAALMYCGDEELRAKVNWALVDVSGRERMRLAGLTRVSPHTYEARALRLVQAIDMIVARRRSGRSG